MKVDFMMIGAQKCGTTSIAAQLAAHPQICFSREKEPGFFHQTEDWKGGLESYHKLYDPKPGQLCGEASTFYTFFPEFTNTHERLYDYNPALKLIYIMRQPVERIVSHYSHNLVRAIDVQPPDRAVFEDPKYINRSRYGVQLRPYLELFGSEKILLLIFEEYIADQLASLARIATFLGINPDLYGEPDTTPQHKSVGQPYIRYGAVRNFTKTQTFQRIRNIVPASVRQPISHRLLSNKLDEKPYFSPALKQSLWRLLEDDVNTVERLIGRRLDSWRKGYSEV